MPVSIYRPLLVLVQMQVYDHTLLFTLANTLANIATLPQRKYNHSMLITLFNIAYCLMCNHSANSSSMDE